MLGANDEELTAHAEVGEQRVVAVGEREPEVLASTAGRLEPTAAQAIGEVGRTGDVSAQRARVAGVDVGDGAADGVLLEPAADDLDLGELGHP